VPTQPNFCDCGIYLLHYAKTFCSNHALYSNLIVNPAKKSDHNTRFKAWRGEEIGESRDLLMQRITTLSKQWKEDEKKKREDTVKLEKSRSSDSEIEYVETTTSKKASRLRG
jgi:Ulp1 family protease